MSKQNLNLFDSLNEGIQIISPELKCIYVNTALTEQINLTKEKISEKGWLKLFPILEKDTLLLKIKESMKQRSNTNFVGKYVCKEEKVKWLEFKIQPFQKGVLIMSSDITNSKLELKEKIVELAEALERENKLKQIKSSYLSKKAHELKAPIGIIKLSTNVLGKMNEHSDTEDVQKYHDHILEEANVLMNLIDGLVAPIQEEMDIEILNYHSFNIFDFLKSFTNEFQENYGDGIAIKIQEQGEATVRLDSVILRRILLTLLKNLIPYSKKGFDIKVNINHRRVVFEITTIGIEVPKAESLFEIQNEKTEFNNVKNYIELLEGIIRIKSGKEKGTTFTILFPIKSIVSVSPL